MWACDCIHSDSHGASVRCQFADGGWQADGRPVQFKPYSKYPPVFKDLSVWLPDASLPGVASSTARELTGLKQAHSPLLLSPPRRSPAMQMRAHPQPHSEEDKKEGITEFWHPHDLYELVRSVAGDVVERVDLQETFVHPVSGR